MACSFLLVFGLQGLGYGLLLFFFFLLGGGVWGVVWVCSSCSEVWCWNWEASPPKVLRLTSGILGFGVPYLDPPSTLY